MNNQFNNIILAVLCSAWTVPFNRVSSLNHSIFFPLLTAAYLQPATHSPGFIKYIVMRRAVIVISGEANTLRSEGNRGENERMKL